MKPAQTVVFALALLVGHVATASPLATAAAKLGATATKLGGAVTKGELLVFGAGLGAGVYVTRKLHQSTGFWAKRIPGTRYRMADLPVGGTVALGAALLAHHDPMVSRILLSASAGMTIGAVGTGLADPLPRATRRTR